MRHCAEEPRGDMFRGVAVPFAMFLVVVVVGVGPSLAAPPLPYNLTHQELIVSLIVNQLAILKVMNESTTSFTSHGDELNQLREDVEKEWQFMNETVVGMKGMNEVMNGTLLREVRVLSEKLENEIKRVNRSSMTATKEVIDKIEGMNGTLQTEITVLSETMNNEIQRLNETGESRTREINEMSSKIDVMDDSVQRRMRELSQDTNNKINAINNTVQRWMTEMEAMNEKLEAAQNSAAFHHQRPDEADLYVTHNDTYDSLCDGHKELYGGDGAFMVTLSGNYSNNMDCSWTVTLPEGSRPVFRWYYFDIEICNPCSKCDYMSVRDTDHTRYFTFCGDDPPHGSFLTVMNNKFKVVFHSDGSSTGRGFNLQYRAVEMI